MSDRPHLCERCELLPPAIASDIKLYLSAPVMATREKLTTALTSGGREITVVDDVIRTTVPEASLDAVADRLAKALSSRELAGTRALVTTHDREPRLTDLIHMESLDSVIARIEGQRVIQLLEGKRLVTYVHPIVHAREPERVFAYECLTRGQEEDGTLVPPSVLFDTARRADLLFYLDRESRMTAIRSGAPLVDGVRLFINFNPSTIYTPEYCLQTTLRTLDETGLGPDDVVFEVVESDRVTDTDHLLHILEFYRERGFQVALDDLGAGFNSLTTLSHLQPDYMKLDIELVRDVDSNPYKMAIVRSLLGLARDLGIVTIAEGIENEREYEWLVDAGADYLQGYYFARPRPVDEVMALR